MDPLSITASSIAVLGVITGAGKGINKLIALRQAPANLQNLSNDIEAFRGVLLMTQMSIRRISHTKEYHDCEEALTVLLLAMQKSVLDLETKINNQLVRRDGGFDQNGFPKVAKVEWLRSGGQIKKMRQKIRDARGNLETGLAAMNLQIRYVRGKWIRNHCQLHSSCRRAVHSTRSPLRSIVHTPQSNL